MRILVCVKQVPDPEADFAPIEDGPGLAVAGGRYLMNPYDAHAVERALELREAVEGTEVTALCLGPERSAAVARRALAMGADRAVHVLCEEERWVSPERTARAIFSVMEGREFDLILTGALAADDEAACVGPFLAGLLSWELACFVVGAGPGAEAKSLVVRREGEGGEVFEGEVPLPAVLTAQTTAVNPRWPTLSNMLRANKAEIETVDFEGLALAPEHAEAWELCEPEEKPPGLFLSGSLEEKARELCRILRERGLL